MSRDTERAVLAAILLWPDNIIEVRDRLTPDLFRYDRNRGIYEAMLACADQRHPPDFLHVSNAMGDEAIPDLNDLLILGSEARVNPYYITHYVDLLVKAGRRRAAAEALAHALQDIQTADEDVDPIEILQRITTALPEYGQGAGPIPFAAIADQLLARLDLQRRGEWQERVVPTGFATLDKLLGGGFRPGELVILAARPGMGKTGLALDVAQTATQVAPSLFYSLEMSAVSLVERAVADAAGFAMPVVRAKHISAEQYARMRDVLTRLREVPVHIDDTSGVTTDQAQVRTQRFMVEHDASLVVADYLEIMGDRNDRSEERRVGTISKKMKHLARTCNVPVVLLCQLSREVEHRNPPVPVLSDLRYSGSIEADADVVMMLYRHDYYVDQGKVEADSARRDTCDVYVRKQRNGATGTVTLGFDPTTMRFTDPTDRELRRVS